MTTFTNSQFVKRYKIKIGYREAKERDTCGLCEKQVVNIETYRFASDGENNFPLPNETYFITSDIGNQIHIDPLNYTGMLCGTCYLKFIGATSMDWAHHDEYICKTINNICVGLYKKFNGKEFIEPTEELNIYYDKYAKEVG